MFDLYKDLVIDHGINPRNKYYMKSFTNHGRGFNFFCGDSFDLYLKIVDNCIKEISFEGKGCSISTASASLMTLSLKKKTTLEALEVFFYFKGLVMKSFKPKEKFGDLNIFSSIKKFPSRVKCATLIWYVFHDILKKRE